MNKYIGKVIKIQPYYSRDIKQDYSVAKLQKPLLVDVDGEFSILIIHKDYEYLKKLLDLLTLEKYNVTISNNSVQALELLEGSLKYDLCILDARMLEISGQEICIKIRQKYSYLDLPILMLIDKTNLRDLVEGYNAGANDFLEKTFQIEELKSRVKTLVNLKKSTTMLLEKETDFLQAQIKPHFIFNALNTISSFCYTDGEKAGKLLTQLSIFLRNSFEFKSDSPFITIEKEVQLVKSYVAIQEARFDSRLEVVYNIEPTCLKYNILPFTIEPLIENSIKHGILKRDVGGKVILSIKQMKKYIYIQIEDNGVGITKDTLNDLRNSNIKSDSVGIKNINMRLNKFYGCSLDIVSKEGEYTLVRFTIPLEC